MIRRSTTHLNVIADRLRNAPWSAGARGLGLAGALMCSLIGAAVSAQGEEKPETKGDARITAIGALSASTMLSTENFLATAADALAADVYKKPEDMVETLEHTQATLLGSQKNLLLLQKDLPDADRRYLAGICQVLSQQEKQAGHLAAFARTKDKTELAKWKRLHEETDALVHALLGIEDGKLASWSCTKDKLGKSLAEKHVAFSLSYPRDWRLDPKSGKEGESFFVQLESTAEEKGKSLLLEEFTASPLTAAGEVTKENEAAMLKTAIATAEAQVAKTWPKWKKEKEGPMKIGHYLGSGFEFSAPLEGGEHLFGRVVLLSPLATKQTGGLKLMIVGTTLTEGIDKLADLGAHGELPILLGSLHIAAPAAKKPVEKK